MAVVAFSGFQSLVPVGVELGSRSGDGGVESLMLKALLVFASALLAGAVAAAVWPAERRVVVALLVGALLTFLMVFATTNSAGVHQGLLPLALLGSITLLASAVGGALVARFARRELN